MSIKITSVEYNNYNDYLLNETILDYQEYYLSKESNIYKVIIYKRNKDIIIKCKNYQLSIDINNLQELTRSYFNNIDEAFDFISELFEENKVSIKQIMIKRELKLKFPIYVYNKEKEFEFILVYNKDNTDLIVKHLNNIYKLLKLDINDLSKAKKESTITNEAFGDTKSITNKSSSLLDNNNTLNSLICNLHGSEYFEEPKDIKFLKSAVNDSYAKYVLDNTFNVFKSIDDIIYLIYTNKNKSIITYDLEQDKKLKEKVNAHNEYISNFRNYLDNKNKRDLILSISCKDNNIKLWNVKNLELLANIENINEKGELNSACFLNDNNQNLILSSNEVEEQEYPEPIKVFNFNGEKIKEINDSKDTTLFIDSYYDIKLKKNYILTSNIGFSKSYDYEENRLYHKYLSDDKRGKFSLIIFNDRNITKLIESGCDGNIRIWNFHTGMLLKKIRISNSRIFSICLWNEDYLLIGCENKCIKIVKMENGKIIKSLIGHKKDVINLEKIFIPQYGNCLLSQGWTEEDIKIWYESLI